MESEQQLGVIYSYMTLICTAALTRILLADYFQLITTTLLVTFSLPVLYTLSFSQKTPPRRFVKPPHSPRRGDIFLILLAFAAGYVFYAATGGTDIVLYITSFTIGLLIHNLSFRATYLVSKLVDPSHPAAILTVSFALAALLTLLLLPLLPLLELPP